MEKTVTVSKEWEDSGLSLDEVKKTIMECGCLMINDDIYTGMETKEELLYVDKDGVKHIGKSLINIFNEDYEKYLK